MEQPEKNDKKKAHISERVYPVYCPTEGYTFEEFEKLLRETGSHYDTELLSRAFSLAQSAHEGQRRTSGEPYFCHPFSVAVILAELGMDTESIAAAFLHDVVEDTEITLDEIKKQFGPEIAMLVDGVTKLTKIPFSTREEQQAENIRKMLLAMVEDIRVIIIKLADRLHNMRTIGARPEQKRRDTSRETLEVYAPIAHRLGIRGVKEELEDLAIANLDPVAYHDIEAELDSKRQERELTLGAIQEKIAERIREMLPNVYIEGRVKSIHGIYRKMYMQGRAFDEIYDIYAIRIIVDTVIDCYNVLGVIHDLFRPLPGRFKDYISTPKPNLYQSLHTTLISRDGVPFEIQIRTWDMHHTAEYGIAAHWKYKEGISRSDQAMENRLAWIRQLLESQSDADDVEEIVRTIKSDLSQEDVFALTPKGDVINLPAGSTVIDFAYAIHSAVGNRMVGAKADRRIVPIDHEIRTGEVIEILTTAQEGHGPSRDWLKIVKTSEARTKIRAWFKKERRAENIAEGRAEVEKEFRRNGILPPEEKSQAFLQEVAERSHCASVEDFYASVGYGGVQLSRIMPRIKENFNRQFKAAVPEAPVRAGKETGPRDGVVVEGVDNLLIKLSRCCDPLPGDPIIGFITRGHGVSIHKRDCTNVPRDTADAEEPERWVNAKWAGVQKEPFKATIQMHALDRSGLLADVTMQLANLHVMIHAINARECRGGSCRILLTVGAENLEHLKSIMARLQKINGVIEVERN